MDLEHDPYQPPQVRVDDAAHFRNLPDAGAWRRFGNYLVDVLAFYVLMVIVIMVLIATSGPESLKPLESGWTSYAISIGGYMAFYIFFEGLWHRTPGKWVTGTLVVDGGGGVPSFGQVVKRTLCRLIPFEAFSLLGDGIGWHDTIPDTRVVRVRGVDAPPTLRA